MDVLISALSCSANVRIRCDCHMDLLDTLEFATQQVRYNKDPHGKGIIPYLFIDTIHEVFYFHRVVWRVTLSTFVPLKNVNHVTVHPFEVSLFRTVHKSNLQEDTTI